MGKPEDKKTEKSATPAEEKPKDNPPAAPEKAKEAPPEKTPDEVRAAAKKDADEAEATRVAEEEKRVKAPFYVAPGKAVTCNRGVVAEFEPMEARFLSGGEEALKALIKNKVVIKRK